MGADRDVALPCLASQDYDPEGACQHTPLTCKAVHVLGRVAIDEVARPTAWFPRLMTSADTTTGCLHCGRVAAR